MAHDSGTCCLLSVPLFVLAVYILAVYKLAVYKLAVYKLAVYKLAVYKLRYPVAINIIPAMLYVQHILSLL